MNDAPIGIFDSGSGGRTVLSCCRALLPRERFIYASDSRAGGWGNLPEEEITARVRLCVETLIKNECKAVVAACNTATASSIAFLRKEYKVPFVGLEPAVLPAVRAYPRGKIVVLCTPATAKQSKFRALVQGCGAPVTVLPQPMLADRIERSLPDLAPLRPLVHEIVQNAQADALVLGCTHYVFLRSVFEEEMGSADRVFDGNEGAARRLRAVLAAAGALRTTGKRGTVEYLRI